MKSFDDLSLDDMPEIKRMFRNNFIDIRGHIIQEIINEDLDNWGIALSDDENTHKITVGKGFTISITTDRLKSK
jgi:hypothetical protein